MRTVSKTICCGVALIWMQGAGAAGVAVSEQAGTIVLESLASPPAQAVSAPPAAPDMASSVQGQPQQASPPATRVPVKAYYEKVQQANIEKRMTDRTTRTQKRKAHAEKDAAERAAKSQMNQNMQQGAPAGQGTSGAQ